MDFTEINVKKHAMQTALEASVLVLMEAAREIVRRTLGEKTVPKIVL